MPVDPNNQLIADTLKTLFAEGAHFNLIKFEWNLAITPGRKGIILIPSWGGTDVVLAATA